MKFGSLIPILLIQGIITCGINYFSFSQTLRTSKVIFNEEEIKPIPELSGKWQLDNNEYITFEKKGDNFYHMTFTERNIKSIHEAVCTYYGGNYYLHVIPFEKKQTIISYLNTLPVNILLQFELNKDNLTIREFNCDFFYSQLSPSSIIEDNNGIIVISEFQKLKEVLQNPEYDEKIQGPSYELTRISSNPDVFKKTSKNSKKPNHKNEFKKIDIEPAFYYADGWLGGDGALSVQLSNNKVLWLFSDSYVSSNPEAKSRKESDGMVSNTIAISKYYDEKDYKKYCWRKSGNIHAPFIESFTNRYRFWVLYAFYQQDTVFVFLAKIGDKDPPNPDDIFNFTTNGTTLAVITDIELENPLKWRIDLFPYTDLYPSSTWSQAGLDDNYLYVIKNLSNKNFVTRIPRKSLLSPDASVEYWSTDLKWKKGSIAEDRMTIFEGQANGSLEYFTEFNSWLYVYGPNFLSKEIKFRYAHEITGPWSDAEVLYQTPEQIPNQPNYDERHFCYLARVHPSFSNIEQKKLLIIYDCNSIEFTHAANSDFIYIPRIIKLPPPKELYEIH